MALADRLLVGAVVAIAGFVVRDQLTGPARARAEVPRVPPPTRADSAQAWREYAGMLDALPQGAKPPRWLRDLHLERLLAGRVPVAPGQEEGEGEREVPGASAAEVARAAAGAGARTYLSEMIREQDSTVTRWLPTADGKPIRVWVQTAPVATDSGGLATGYVRAAFRVWNGTASGVPFEIVGDSTAAQVHVTWALWLGDWGGFGSSPAYPGARPAPRLAGHTIRLANAEGWVVAAHVVLAASRDLAAVQNTALHEAGHVLGLGHSPERGDQMAAITDGRHFALSDADRATLLALYTLTPGRVRGEP